MKQVDKDYKKFIWEDGVLAIPLNALLIKLNSEWDGYGNKGYHVSIVNPHISETIKIPEDTYMQIKKWIRSQNGNTEDKDLGIHGPLLGARSDTRSQISGL